MKNLQYTNSVFGSFYKLKKRFDFIKVAKSGNYKVAFNVIMQILNHDSDVIRVGFTVTRKVDKRAVYRNFIRRRLRAAFRILYTCSPELFKRGCDYVFIGRKSTAVCPWDNLLRDFKFVLKSFRVQ